MINNNKTLATTLVESEQLHKGRPRQSRNGRQRSRGHWRLNKGLDNPDFVANLVVPKSS